MNSASMPSVAAMSSTLLSAAGVSIMASVSVPSLASRR